MSKTIIALFFTIILDSCANKTSEWATIKATKHTYPKESIEKFVSTEYSSLLGRKDVWINRGLKNYSYKMYCPEKIVLSYPLRFEATILALKNDSLELAKKALKVFQENGIAHFAFQIIEKETLDICLYTEEGINAIQLIKSFEIPVHALLEEDYEWKTFTQYYDLK